MAYRVLRHPAISNDLLQVVDLLLEFAGKDVALRKLNEIEVTLKKLATTPHTGTIRNDIYPQLRAIPCAGKGVITFIVDDELQEVRILSITYAGANWLNRLSSRT